MELAESGVKRTGSMLAAARTDAGLELVDVARETRVPLRHLKALEADRHEDLPALPYAIGFVKAYARAVGLDPETVAAQFRGETSKSAHVPTQMSLEPLDERRLPSGGLVATSVIVVVVIIAALSAWGAGVFDPAPPATAVAAAPVAADPAATETAAAVTTDATLPATAGVTPAATTPTGPVPTGQVVLTAREPVWVKIYDATTRTAVKVGTLAAGERFAVPAGTPGLLLWTGKAGALDVSIGGRAIPPLGGPVETVRDLSLAPADLVARTTAAAAPAATGPTPIAQIPRPRAEPLTPPPAGT